MPLSISHLAKTEPAEQPARQSWNILNVASFRQPTVPINFIRMIQTSNSGGARLLPSAVARDLLVVGSDRISE